jgi:predicted acetyltransferase
VAVELVNPVAAEEIEAWARAMATTFLHDPTASEATWQVGILRDRWHPERAWGARERGRWVATLRTEPRSMTVVGSERGAPDLEIDALTNVTVAATHRRRGLMSQLLSSSLRAAHERGEAASALIAAEWPIYGRFGYAPATLSADYELLRSRPGARCEGDPSRLRQVEREEFGALAPDVFGAARRQRAGQLDRPGWWWANRFGLEGREPAHELPKSLFVHEGERGPDGLLGWSPADSWAGLLPPLGGVAASLTAASDDAYRDLWAYLTGIDGVDTIVLNGRPADERARWMLADGRTLLMRRHFDFLWLRLLDVPAALSARRCAVEGELTLEVVDEDGDCFAAGRYALTAGADGMTVCERTGARADLRLTQRALAAAYLGGFALSGMAPGAARELRQGALTRLEAMLATPLAPWNATWF